MAGTPHRFECIAQQRLFLKPAMHPFCFIRTRPYLLGPLSIICGCKHQDWLEIFFKTHFDCSSEILRFRSRKVCLACTHNCRSSLWPVGTNELYNTYFSTHLGNSFKLFNVCDSIRFPRSLLETGISTHSVDQLVGLCFSFWRVAEGPPLFD